MRKKTASLQFFVFDNQQKTINGATEALLHNKDLTFTYRFGKAVKPGKRPEGSAGKEKSRVGTGS